MVNPLTMMMNELTTKTKQMTLMMYRWANILKRITMMINSLPLSKHRLKLRTNQTTNMLD